MKLLIVESPGKLKTLRKILGREWILEASVGHTTELAHDGEKKLGFDIGENFIRTRYIPRGDRGRQVLSKLRAVAKQVDTVYLAMDPDREGEAIAWHLCEQLRLKKFVRVSYTQITESAVKAAIAKPRALDLPLIQAQRARQCLDKLVGFEVSPLLWNSTGGKSAGRVQSATLHLVCERERERLAFKPQDYWVLTSHYRDGEKFAAQFEPKATPEKKVLAETEALRIKEIASRHPHIVTDITDREEVRRPLPPLITSSLQQTAGVRLKFSPQKTMKIAQELYEGVGGQGLITYMRTDAVTLSQEFIEDARAWLQKNAPQALGVAPPVFKVKADAQGAHEAIRPTSVAMTPAEAKSILNQEQFAVYQLIWERAVASQCRAARLSRGEIEIHAGETRWLARGLIVLDPGYLIFWRNIDDEKELPRVTPGQILNLREIKVEAKKTQPPSRYSEAKLVQLMEKLGIGRPSTYASTIMTLRERDYVVLDGPVLAPTALGMSTDEVLTKALPDLVDVKFTAKMEKSLDQIADGSIGWEKFLCDWNFGYFRSAMINARALIGQLPKSARVFTARSKSRPARTPSGQRPSEKSRGKFKKFASAAKRKPAAPAGEAPSCQRGHGLLASRVSKKGAAYWKCGEKGCDSWAWPGKKL